MKPIGIDTGATYTGVLTDEGEQKFKTPPTKGGYLTLLGKNKKLLEDSLLVDAVAGPISPDGREVKITNQDWGILTTDEIEEASGAGRVVLVNDLKAVGKGVVEVKWKESRRVVSIAGKKLPNVYGVVMAPGTGIGVAKITPEGDVLAGEGGWVLAQATDELEEKAISRMQEELGRYVACEDLAGNPALYKVWYPLLNMVNEDVERARDKPVKISELAKNGDAYCIAVMKRAAKFLGQCAQANMLSPPICDALCLVGHYGDDRYVEGYTEELLKSFYNSRHGERLRKVHIYTVKDADNLGAVGSLAFAKEML